MCGFIGQFNVKRSPDDFNIIKSASECLNCRGPDQKGFYKSDNFVLATRRLSINNISNLNADQPFVRENIFIGFNGEIFNYKSIAIKYLNNSDENLTEIELIYFLYKKYHTNFFKLLNGQFSIVIYDSNKNILILSRDPLGIRPLYYVIKNQFIIFSSSTQSIHQTKLIEKSIDQLSLNISHLMWAPLPNSSIYKDIKQVDLGSFVKIKLQNNRFEMTEEKYWEWEQILKNSNVKSKFSIEDYLDDFKLELEKSIDRQSMSDTGYSIYLSGGIDSSVIATYLSTKKTKPDTFSVFFNDSDYDESKKISHLLKQTNLNNYSLKISDDDISDNFTQGVKAIDSPIFRTAPIPMYLLSKQVKQKGHKVVLSGEGADELLFGYDLFREIKIKKFVLDNSGNKKRRLLYDNLYQYLPQFKNTKYRKFVIDYMLNVKSPDPFFDFMSTRIVNNYSTLEYLNENLFEESIKLIKEYLPNSFDSWDELIKAQYIEIVFLLHGYLLSSQADRVSMANSIEGRYPYLDLEFIKFVITKIPLQLKLNGNNFKYILKKAYEDLIPGSIINSPKIAYQSPEARVFFENSRLKKQFMHLDNPKDNVYEFYNYKKTQKLINKLSTSNPNSRIGFRDNMSCVMLLSLSKIIK